jgi:DNA-binding transcriptional LysR family regulator
MFSFRLQVFYSVATHLSFTKAAEELFVTQPAVTKSIKELESELDIRLFNRKGNRIDLTEAGHILFQYVEQIAVLHNKLDFDLSVLRKRYSGQLRIGASTTIGQYVLPPVLALFNQKYPEINLSLINNNTQKIEKALIDGQIDIGVVEGNSKNTQLKYVPFLKDEIVAVAHTSQKLSERDEITLDELKDIPLVLREIGSGSLDVITDKLRQYKIKLKDLNIIMNLGSTESIKSFLANSDSLGLISISAVSKNILNGEFKIIDIKDFNLERPFYFIHQQGNVSGFADVFVQFVQRYYNQKL